MVQKMNSLMATHELYDYRLGRENNKVKLVGFIDQEFEFNHTRFSRYFYKTFIKVFRKNKLVDRLPIIVDRDLVEDYLETSVKGKFVELGGEFRSKNIKDESGSSHLFLYIYAKFINIFENDETTYHYRENLNSIYLEGHVCKRPYYRVTTGWKETTDIILAIDRNTGMSDYIPLKCWSGIARYSRYFKVGDKIKIVGEIRSRDYIKAISLEEQEQKTAYEVTVAHMLKVRDE